MARVQRSVDHAASWQKNRAPTQAHLRSVTSRQEPRVAAGQETQGRHLARLIQKAGLNNNSVAKLSGVRRESISRIVNDHARLGPRLAERLAPALGVTVDDLVVPLDQHDAALRRLEGRVRELEEDRDYLLQAVRQLVTHLDHAGLGAPRMPPAPRSSASIARPLGAEVGQETVLDAEPGRRRPRLSRHR
jgi:plasmid maintenance system antidote protein VapI